MSKQPALNSVLRFGITYEQVAVFDILCLPENLDTVLNADELYDASDTITLSKLLKAQGIKCANSYDLNLSAQIFERRSAEKWFGTVYIRNNVVIPVFVGVLSTLIATEISEIKNNDEPVPKVHIELKLEKPNNLTTLKYDGDSATLITILKSIGHRPTESNEKHVKHKNHKHK